MDKRKVEIAQDVAGVAGLVGVWSEGRFYAGKVERSWPEALKPPSNEYLVLAEAYWLAFPTRPLPDGQIELRILPMPIPPFEGATTVLVRIGAIVDLSREAGLVDIHRAMTGSSGLVLPRGVLR